jgi:hypothetical protein
MYFMLNEVVFICIFKISVTHLSFNVYHESGLRKKIYLYEEVVGGKREK